jgi:hypothetical protein
MTQPRALITGKDHPHCGKRGTAVALQTFKHGIMPPMVEIRFDDGDGCFAKKEEVMIDPYTCERCGGQKAHSRLKGLFCPACNRRR